MGASGMTELVLLEENGQTRLRHRGAPLAMRGTRSALPQDHPSTKDKAGAPPVIVIAQDLICLGRRDGIHTN